MPSSKCMSQVEKKYMSPVFRFFSQDGVGGTPELTQPDGLHPTAEGAAIVAKNVFAYLEPLLHDVAGYQK